MIFHIIKHCYEYGEPPQTAEDLKYFKIANTPRLKRLCDGLGNYYLMMGRNDYYSKNGRGKFTKWFIFQEFDIEDMEDEMDPGNIDDCSYLDFDDNFPLELISKEDETERRLQQFEIMQRIWQCDTNTFIAY